MQLIKPQKIREIIRRRFQSAQTKLEAAYLSHSSSDSLNSANENQENVVKTVENLDLGSFISSNTNEIVKTVHKIVNLTNSVSSTDDNDQEESNNPELTINQNDSFEPVDTGTQSTDLKRLPNLNPLELDLNVDELVISTYKPVEKVEEIKEVGEILYFGDDNIYNVQNNNVILKKN